MLGRAKDYDLLAGKTVVAAHSEIKCCQSDCQSKIKSVCFTQNAGQALAQKLA